MTPVMKKPNKGPVITQYCYICKKHFRMTTQDFRKSGHYDKQKMVTEGLPTNRAVIHERLPWRPLAHIGIVP